MQVFLHWPTSLAINPLDDSLHILDNNLVLKLTHDNLVVTIVMMSIFVKEYLKLNNDSRIYNVLRLYGNKIYR